MGTSWEQIGFPVYNVKDPAYAGGAAGDGVTDDTAAIQAAIDDITAANNAATLYFPPGVYLISDTLLVGGFSRLTIQGSGSRIDVDGEPQMEWAQETTNATAMKLLEGSFVRWRRVS
jgi:hypothetical protein